MKKRVVVLGATGSIGESTMRVARALSDKIEIVGISGRNNTSRLLDLAREFPSARICAGDVAGATELSHEIGRPILHGEQGLMELASLQDAELVLVAIVGTAGLKPALHALESDKDLAVASKEILVMAGELVMETAARMSGRVLPVDSEHNAIFQAMADGNRAAVERIILTASGGPFRTASIEEMRAATPEKALRHPVWTMGAKISIDSATMMNKGLEVIEAARLFNLPSDRIDVLVHPQSTVHGLVCYADGSVLAQLGSPDMRVPIAHALAWPERIATAAPRLDLIAAGRLDFAEPDPVRFPALRLAREALLAGGGVPALMSAANEIAVEAFLSRRIGFLDIAAVVEQVMLEMGHLAADTLEAVIDIDLEARARAAKACAQREFHAA